MMLLKFDATKDLDTSLSDVETLVTLAKKEVENVTTDTENNYSEVNDKNRELFLKLAVTSLITKFQVFIENILREYKYTIINSNKTLSNFTPHLRLNALKLYVDNSKLQDKLKDPNSYTTNKLENIKGLLDDMANLCEDRTIINSKFGIDTKFPLGKTGTNELVKLFKQIDGINIFDQTGMDAPKLDEILYKRHAVIHDDANPQLTELIIEDYVIYIKDFAKKVDNYLGNHI